MATGEKAVNWKVKAEDGSIFGPASMATLLAWARDGRLAASHVISSDGKNWTPVATHPELAMDWIAEITPGKFYGPTHRDALDELIRNGDLRNDVPQYVRTRSIEDSPSALKDENSSLKAQIEALRADFASRTGKLEEELAAAEAEKEELKSQLETRDLDFEAERQEFKAAESKIQAELAKAEKKSAALAVQVEHSGVRDRSHAADSARIAELENKVSALEVSLKKTKAEADEAAATARREFKETDIELQKTRAEFDKFKNENQASASKLKALQLREESVRKLLQQASAIMNESSSSSDFEDAEIVTVS